MKILDAGYGEKGLFTLLQRDDGTTGIIYRLTEGYLVYLKADEEVSVQINNEFADFLEANDPTRPATVMVPDGWISNDEAAERVVGHKASKGKRK